MNEQEQSLYEATTGWLDRHTRSNTTWVSAASLLLAGPMRMHPAQSVLDVGTAIRPQSYIPAPVHLCIEPHPEYSAQLLNSHHVVIRSTWDAIMPFFADDSVDSVFALDFIEHLSKDDGYRFLQQAQRIARHQVVVFTPLGFLPQNFDDPATLDHYGMHGLSWQTHQSGWNVEDFDDPWEIVACNAFHTNDQDGKPLSRPIGAFWAFWNKGL
jgi:hypothetical protein